MGNDSKTERRRYKRLRKNCKVRVKFTGDDSYNVLAAKSVNVSTSGILVEHDKPIELNKIVNVRFLHPNSFDYFEGDARVIRCELNDYNNSYYVGIEFIDLGEEEERKLDRFLTSADELGSDKRIKVLIEPTWNIVLNINDRIEEIIPDAKTETVERVRMVSTELVENAVKYGESIPGLTGIEFELMVDSNMITVIVKNGVITDSNANEVINCIDKIENSDDHFKLYTDRLTELIRSSKLEESKLGLYRIAYEGNCDLDCSYENNILTVISRINL